MRAALGASYADLCALLHRVPALPLVRCEVLLYASRRPAQAASALQQERYVHALQVCYRVACAEGELGLIACEDLAAVVSSSIDGLALQTAAGVPLAQQEATRAHVRRALLALVPGRRPAHRRATTLASLGALSPCSRRRRHVPAQDPST